MDAIVLVPVVLTLVIQFFVLIRIARIETTLKDSAKRPQNDRRPNGSPRDRNRSNSGEPRTGSNNPRGNDARGAQNSVARPTNRPATVAPTVIKSAEPRTVDKLTATGPSLRELNEKLKENRSVEESKPEPRAERSERRERRPDARRERSNGDGRRDNSERAPRERTERSAFVEPSTDAPIPEKIITAEVVTPAPVAREEAPVTLTVEAPAPVAIPTPVTPTPEPVPTPVVVAPVVEQSVVEAPKPTVTYGRRK